MTFVDTNVIMYAVGRSHPLRQEAREFFQESQRANQALVTSAEVLQELLHAYLPVGRTRTLAAAFRDRLQVLLEVSCHQVRGRCHSSSAVSE